MKRLSQKARARLIRLSRKAARRKHRQRAKRAIQRQRARYTSTSLRAPSEFNLATHKTRSELLEFLGGLRTSLLIDRKPLVLDFSYTQRMVSGGTLLFLAELLRCKELLGSAFSVRCLPPRNVKVAQVLKQIGVFDLANFHKKITAKFSDVVHWKVATGCQVDGSKYDDILGAYEGRVADPLLSSLFRGITEAMTNCHHHAYIATRPDGLGIEAEPRNWWMFSQERGGALTVVFCDLGVGIPVSLPKKKRGLWETIVSLGKAGSDSSVIDHAVTHSRTRTGKHYRGKGLKQLLEAARESKGTLRIFSNRGCYTYHDGKTHLRDFSESIMGTLIQWKVPIVQQELFSGHAGN